MTNLVEFKVSKTIFDDVKNDPGFRIGFEAEFHVKNASDLLRDANGQLPADFMSFANSRETNLDPVPDDYDPTMLIDHENTVLYRLSQLLGQNLGVSLDITHPSYKSGYQQWKLTTDASVKGADDDLGVELISPILPLRDGLAWLAKVCQMIASFQHGAIRLYTSGLTGLHVNLSHVLMEYNGLDFAKLAILGGDEHYLADFDRIKNTYAQPILRAVYDLLVAVKQHPNSTNEPALNLLKLKGWDASRVMLDLSMLIPMAHHMSIDFRRLSGNNPYIEIRIAGNAQYEQRFDEIAKMTIRYAALVKIGCDPTAYREEYLKKIYQLVSGVTPGPATQPRENPLPRIRIFLQPIMSRATRASLDRIETYVAGQTMTIPNGAYLFLTVLRSAIDMRLANSLRIKQGLNMLLGAIGLNTNHLFKALKEPRTMLEYGVMRSSDKPAQIIAVLTNAIKGLNQPVAKPAQPQMPVNRPMPAPRPF